MLEYAVVQVTVLLWSLIPGLTDADIDCVDMEGYALAYVAQQYHIPFRAWKYISDMADENAPQNGKRM